MTLHIRIPGWARGKPVPGDLYRYIRSNPEPVRLLINGESVPVRIKNGYAVLRRKWQPKDRITLNLTMTVRRVSAHEGVAANRGKVAVERGPLVYCAEGIDQPDKQVRHLVLPHDTEFEVQFEPGLLNGVYIIRSPVRAVHALSNKGLPDYPSQTLTLIPYYAWAHRGRTEMSVWLAGARVNASRGRGMEAVNNQIEPVSFNDHEIDGYHWRLRKGLVQQLECHSQEPVVNFSEYTVQPDRFNRVPFRPVRTRGFRMEIQSQEGWTGGVLESRVKQRGDE